MCQVHEYGLGVVQAYMEFIQSAAETAVRRMLRDFSESRGLDAANGAVTAEDFLDDGTPIKLKVGRYCDGLITIICDGSVVW